MSDKSLAHKAVILVSALSAGFPQQCRKINQNEPNTTSYFLLTVSVIFSEVIASFRMQRLLLSVFFQHVTLSSAASVGLSGRICHIFLTVTAGRWPKKSLLSPAFPVHRRAHSDDSFLVFGAEPAGATHSRSTGHCWVMLKCQLSGWVLPPGHRMSFVHLNSFGVSCNLHSDSRDISWMSWHFTYGLKIICVPWWEQFHAGTIYFALNFTMLMTDFDNMLLGWVNECLCRTWYDEHNSSFCQYTK